VNPDPIQVLFEEANTQCRIDASPLTIYYYEMSVNTINRLISKGEVCWVTTLPSKQITVTGKAKSGSPPERYKVISTHIIGYFEFRSHLYPNPTWLPVVENDSLPLGKAILRKHQIKS